MPTGTAKLFRDGGYWGGGRGRLHTNHYTVSVTTRMTPALRWAAMRAILMFQKEMMTKSQDSVHKPQSFWREGRAEAESSRCPSAYQPNALPLGQTGSRTVRCKIASKHPGKTFRTVPAFHCPIFKANLLKTHFVQKSGLSPKRGEDKNINWSLHLKTTKWFYFQFRIQLASVTLRGLQCEQPNVTANSKLWIMMSFLQKLS